MTGRNLFLESGSSRATDSGTCVFITYRKADVKAARVVAQLLKVGIKTNIYFDELDPKLPSALQTGDDRKLVTYLEDGIRASTHILGIISPNTVGSWWVPFEIGSARQRSLPVAYVLLDEVNDLPSYLVIAKLIRDRIELGRWLDALDGVQLNEGLQQTIVHPIPGLPRVRFSTTRFRNAE